MKSCHGGLSLPRGRNIPKSEEDRGAGEGASLQQVVREGQNQLPGVNVGGSEWPAPRRFGSGWVMPTAKGLQRILMVIHESLGL